MVESVIKVLSLCHLVNEAIPIPCMNKEMTPMYDNIIPFCSGAIPNCSMAITFNKKKGYNLEEKYSYRANII